MESTEIFILKAMFAVVCVLAIDAFSNNYMSDGQYIVALFVTFILSILWIIVSTRKE